MVRGRCVSGRLKPYALAGPPHTDGVERTSRANVPGKSGLQIGEIDPYEFMYKRGTSRHTLHPTLRALGVAAMRRGERLDVQEHTRNARSRSLV